MAARSNAKKCSIRGAQFLILSGLAPWLIGCATLSDLSSSKISSALALESATSESTDEQVEIPTSEKPIGSAGNALVDSSADAVSLAPEVHDASTVEEEFDKTVSNSLENEAMEFDLEQDIEQTLEPTAMLLSDMPFRKQFDYRTGQLLQDYRNFYSTTNLTNLAVGFAAGAAMANTNFDEMVGHDLFRENVVDVANEEYSEQLHQSRFLGDGYFILPIIGGTALAQPWLQKSERLEPLGEWGDRSARAILTGGPFVLLMQRITGASRPNETSSQSHWEPLQDNNGVSGHAFVGAVPFLAAAQMTDRPFIKAACYVGSVMPAIARINDDRHYFSQVFLGWYIALLATHSVHQTQTGADSLRFFPTFDRDGMGMVIEKRF